MTAPLDPGDFEELQVRVYASLVRVIERAPVENKLAVFSLMAREAGREVAAFRQRQVDDLWMIADATGLLSIFGSTMVQDALAVGFGGQR